MDKYGFIGCGNMGGALIRAAAKSVAPERLMIADRDAQKVRTLADGTGAAASEAADIAGTCRQIFLGVKPQGMEELFAEIRPVLQERTDRFVLVTMAAGVPVSRIRAFAGREDVPVIRLMPNLPASVGEGMIVWCAEGATDEEKEVYRSLLSHAGRLLEVPEEMIDAGTGLSGSGPGYICYFIEALVKGGERVGFTKEEATALAVQTVKGTAVLLSETGVDPAALRKAVCSPHGTTLAGLSALEEGSFFSDTEEAVVRAYNRAKEL